MRAVPDNIKTFSLLCIGCVTISFNVAAITAAVPVMSASLGYTDFSMARIIPFYLLPYGLSALLYAPLTRYLTYQKVLVLTMLIYALASLVCGLTQSMTVLLAGRILMGIAGSSAIPLGLMIIGETFHQRVRGRFVGGFFSCSFAASLLGVGAGSWLSWPWLFWIPAGLGVLLVILILALKCSHLQKTHVGRINYLKTFENHRICKIFLFIFVLSFLYHGLHKWYGVYLSREYGFDQSRIGVFFALTVVAGFFGQHIGGVISDVKGRSTACYVGILGLGGGALLLVAHHTVFVLALILGLVSVCWTIGHNGVSTALTDFDEIDRPAIASLNSCVRFLSGGLGFQLSALFVEQSFRLTFFTIGILILLLTFSIRGVLK